MRKYLLFFLIAIGQLSIAAEEPLVSEIERHLSVLRTFPVEREIESLTIEEASEKATKESTDPAMIGAFWGIQRGIEKLMEEEHSFETFTGVVRTIKAFGEEMSPVDFWKLAKHIYMTTEITPKPYEGENHWQSWFRMHEGPSFTGTREDILGCLLYPVRYTFTHYMNEWQLNPFVFYLQAHSASYGNAYARVKTTAYLKIFADNEDCMETKILQSKLLAVTSPFNSSFNIDSDMNKLLWAAFANSMEMYQCAYTPRETDELIWPQATEVLQQIKIKTGEVLYFLAECLNHIGQREKAIEFWEESGRSGFRESLSILRKERLVTTRSNFLESTTEMMYTAYEEVFGVEV